MNNLPFHATGVSSPGESSRIVGQINGNDQGRQESLMIELIHAVKDGKNIVVDG